MPTPASLATRLRPRGARAAAHTSLLTGVFVLVGCTETTPDNADAGRDAALSDAALSDAALSDAGDSGHVCPALGCAPQCEFGVQRDAYGCIGCTCAPGPDAGGLRWYRTCGLPVCRDPYDAGVATCSTGAEGGDCGEAGVVCDPGLGCGVMLRCADAPIDTRVCPISSRKYKADIHYLTPAELGEVATRVERIQLATYDYKQKAPAEQRHFGFIIEDDPTSSAVFVERERVDLYGYASMAVATLQVQARRIADLEQQVAELRALLKRARRGPAQR